MRGSGSPHRYWAREWNTSVSRPNVLGCPVTTLAGQSSVPINRMDAQCEMDKEHRYTGRELTF